MSPENLVLEGRTCFHWPGPAGAPRFLALHGFTGRGSDFGPLVEAAGGAWWAPDLAGHGPSSCAPEAHALPRQAEAIGALREAAGLDLPWLVGYSFGGRLALHVALAAPERYRGLILIGATAGIADPAERAARRARDAQLAATLEGEGVASFLARWQALPLIATQARIAAPARARMAEARREHAARGLADSLRGAGTGAMEPLWSRLGELRLPTLLLVGEEDEKFLALGERLVEGLPDARLSVVPDAGHCAHLEAPAASARALRAFLSAP